VGVQKEAAERTPSSSRERGFGMRGGTQGKKQAKTIGNADLTTEDEF